MARTTLARRNASRSTRSTRRSSARSRPPATTRRSSARRTSTRRATRSRSADRPRTTQGQKEIQVFLDRFVSEMTDGDGRAVAARFEYPALMVMSSVGDYGGAQLLQDEPTVSDFFDRAPDQYQAKGVYQTTALVEDVQWIADDLALVRATFPYLDEDGDDMGDSESSVYVLRKVGDGFHICAAITLGAASDREQGITKRRNA